MSSAPYLLLAMRSSHSRYNFELELARQGFQVVTAADGLSSLAVLRRITPAVVILEPELTWGGGEGVLAVMRSEPRLEDIPVLVLATQSDRSAIYRISQFPISDFLNQPASPQQVVARVMRLLGTQMERAVAEVRVNTLRTVPIIQHQITSSVKQ